MSSTKRGGKRSEADFYSTPAWCTRRILEALALPKGLRWLDPCAGEGAILEVVAACADPKEIHGIELRVEPAILWGFTCADALAVSWPDSDVLIMNPPFSLARDFVGRALDASPCVIALERLNWIVQWVKHGGAMPGEIYVLPDRPSFTGHGSDSIEYAWFVWRDAPRAFEILPGTPLSERRA
jgi:predicted RNA methylase